MQITQPVITSSKLPIKTAERCDQLRSGVFIVNFEHIFAPYSSISIVNFQHVNAGWETDCWLVTFYQMVFDEFPHRTSIYNANFFGNQKSENCPPVSLLVWKVFIENVKGIRGLFFLFMAIKSYLKIGQTQNTVRCRQLCSRCVIRAHLKCILGAC